MDNVEDMVREGVLHALRSLGVQAYFEAMARTDPRLFAKYAVALLPTHSTGKAAGSGQHVVVQVVSAIPRSPLDALPEGFTVG